MALPTERAHLSRAAPAPKAQLHIPRLALILAVAANGTIGAQGTLPWRLPEDLKRFRALTWGHALIMGRKTWASLGKPLDGRQNIVVTRDRAFSATGAEVAYSLDDALAKVALPPPAFCIGGAELYAFALPYADVLYLTEIERDFHGDTSLPPLDRERWIEIARERHVSAGPEKLPFAFVTYARRSDAPSVGQPAPAGAPRASQPL